MSHILHSTGQYNLYKYKLCAIFVSNFQIS